MDGEGTRQPKRRKNETDAGDEKWRHVSRTPISEVNQRIRDNTTERESTMGSHSASPTANPGPQTSGPDTVREYERYYGIDIDAPGEAAHIQRLEQSNTVETVRNWADEGIPIDAMGIPSKMEAYRSRKGTPVPWNVEQRNEQSVQRSKRAAADTSTAGETNVPESVRDVISSPGKSLDTAVQRAMEDRMGGDFGDVQVHTGPRAVAAADAINARAFTVGNNIAFNRGEYNPSSAAGQHVLAHELAHVRQQTGGAVSMLPQDPLDLEIDPDPQLEREAETTANRVMEGGEIGIQCLAETTVHVQRMPGVEVGGPELSGGSVESEVSLKDLLTQQGPPRPPTPEISPEGSSPRARSLSGEAPTLTDVNQPRPDTGQVMIDVGPDQGPHQTSDQQTRSDGWIELDQDTVNKIVDLLGRIQSKRGYETFLSTNEVTPSAQSGQEDQREINGLVQTLKQRGILNEEIPENGEILKNPNALAKLHHIIADVRLNKRRESSNWGTRLRERTFNQTAIDSTTVSETLTGSITFMSIANLVRWLGHKPQDYITSLPTGLNAGPLVRLLATPILTCPSCGKSHTTYRTWAGIGTGVATVASLLWSLHNTVENIRTQESGNEDHSMNDAASSGSQTFPLTWIGGLTSWALSHVVANWGSWKKGRIGEVRCASCKRFDGSPYTWIPYTQPLIDRVSPDWRPEKFNRYRLQRPNNQQGDIEMGGQPGNTGQGAR